MRRQREPHNSARPYRRVFVLSGGGALGAIQVGQLRALVEADITPDALVACSVGALNAAGYAQAPGLDRVGALEEYWRGLTRDDVFPGGKAHRLWHLATGRPYLHRADGIHKIVERWCGGSDLSELELPIEVATVNLTTGRLSYFSRGDPFQILAASCALPGIFPPVVIGGQTHVDGGVLASVPLERARSYQADEIWVLDCAQGTPYRAVTPTTALGAFVESFAVARYELAGGTAQRARSGDARVRFVPAPDVGARRLDDFSRTGALIESAYDLTRRALDAGLGDRREPLASPANSSRRTRRHLLRRSNRAGALTSPVGAESDGI